MTAKTESPLKSWGSLMAALAPFTRWGAPGGVAAASLLLAVSIHRGCPFAWNLAFIAVANVFYLLTILTWWNLKRPGPGALVLVASYALIARLALLTTPPLFSDDIFRYVWEGRVTAEGLNPYLYIPEAWEVSHLRDEIWWQVSYKEVSAIYPPLAQAIFAAVAALGGAVIAMKAAFVLLDLAVAVLVAVWLHRNQKPLGRVVVWLLHPLVLIEFAASGHLDVLVCLGLLTTMIFLSGSETRADGKAPEDRPQDAAPPGGAPWRHWGAAFGACVGLAVATLAKLAPIAFLPHLARKLPIRRWPVLLSVPLLVFLAYLPFLDAGSTLFRALDNYESQWQNNESIYKLVDWLVYRVDPQGSVYYAVTGTAGELLGIDDLGWRLLNRRQDTAPSHPLLFMPRFITYLIFGLIWLLVLLRSRAPWDVQWFYLMGSALLLSPVNHPWYLTMLIPCFLRRWRPIALWWTLTIPFSYAARGRFIETGVWQESAAAWWLQYGGMAAIALIYLGWTQLRRRNGDAVRAGSAEDVNGAETKQPPAGSLSEDAPSPNRDHTGRRTSPE